MTALQFPSVIYISLNFNSHNYLWGWNKIDVNGWVMETKVAVAHSRLEPFKDLCSDAFIQGDLKNQGIQLDTFIVELCEIANETVPKSYPNPKKPQISLSRLF